MILKVLFLDDDPERHDAFFKGLKRRGIDAELAEIHVAYSIMDAQNELRDNSAFDIAFLDHDLGGRQMVMQREGTGTIVAEYIAAMPPEQHPRLVVVHSFNAVGAGRMVETLRNAGVRCLQIPFDATGFYDVFKW